MNKQQQLMQQSFIEHVDENLLMDCMRCGFCLPACPTYIHTEKDETQSPRGRIALMKAIRDGVCEWDSSTQEAIDLCLGCRACEPACPAGVQYGQLIEQAKVAVNEVKPKGPIEKVARKVAFDHLFAKQSAMKGAVGLVQFYQKSGLQKATRSIGFLNLFPTQVKEMEAILPDTKKDTRPKLPVRKNQQVKVAFFAGCLMDTLFNKINEQTIELLKFLGAEVIIPEKQACCGALHGHSGEMEKAHCNSKLNIDAFGVEEVDYIVNNAGGCGAFLSEYDQHLAYDQAYAEKAKDFVNKQIDISSLLVKLGLPAILRQLQPTSSTVITYQDSCHLRNVNHVINEPRALLKAIPGAQFKELPQADLCCGSAGIYNLLQPEMAETILESKMEKAENLQSEIIITSNPGCLMQMQKGVKKYGSCNQDAQHIVTYLYDFIQQNRSTILAHVN